MRSVIGRTKARILAAPNAESGVVGIALKRPKTTMQNILFCVVLDQGRFGAGLDGRCCAAARLESRKIALNRSSFHLSQAYRTPLRGGMQHRVTSSADAITSPISD